VLGRSSRHFGPADLALAEDVAGRAAIALDNCLLYEEIHRADRRKNEFLATLSHELRNPLAPLRAALHALRLGRATESESERLRGMMDRQVGHISHLVDDLLDVARITSGKIELRKERVELAIEVRDALEACRSTENAAGHDFSLSLPEEPLVADVDRIRLQQILENLLMNAVKYTEPEGRIGITLARDGRDAVIRVWDTGIGIAPEMLPRIWDLFTQANTSSERVRQGLGIGLSLAQNMVRLHGGSIEARSDGLGRGSVFTVRLPCASEAQLPAAVSNDPANGAYLPAISRRVLVVDDNADAAESLGMVLNLLGHQAQLACNGAEALRIAADFQPEIIFLDIGLPGMDGYEIAGHIRRGLGMTTARLIALSGFGTEQDRRRSMESGFDAHVIKPLDPDRLPELLNDPAPTGARSTRDRAA
jgi:CheY-like chemotaxis protein